MAKADIIGSIEKKVARLIADNRRLRDERSKLAAAKERLRGENRQLAERLAEAERTVAILELREGFAGETVDKTSTRAARARVNRLMREVDRCLALLNKDDGTDSLQNPTDRN
jgi:regulator of replication initiation timing